MSKDQKPNNRIESDDTLMEIFSKLSDGNAGAFTVLLRIMEYTAKYHQEGYDLAGLNMLGILDTTGIYSFDIWLLYKDICKENIEHFIQVLKAYQYGFVDEKTIHEAIDTKENYKIDGPELDVELLVQKVDQAQTGKYN